MNNSKECLRKKYKDIRKNITNKKEKDKCIFSKVIENKSVCVNNTILIYFSKDDEVDTKALIEYFLSIHKKVALPKTYDKTISFFYIDNIQDIKLGKYGIFEPIGNHKVIDFSNSICIVPGICFDVNNYRIGYGGGYYDRFLESYKGITIGLTYQECIIDKIDIDNYDKCVDIVITD